MVTPQIRKIPYLSIYTQYFVYETPTHCVVIDTGLSEGPAFLQGETRGRETVVLSTHGHYDHTGNHSGLAKRGARLLANAGDRRYFEDYNWHWRVLFGQFEEDFDLPPARRTLFWERGGAPCEATYALQEGAVLAFGELRFRVLHTPGHSPGSVCLLEENSGALFTGDTLIGEGFFAATPQYCDLPKYLASMERLKDVRAQWVYSCHNAPAEGKTLRETALRGQACALTLDEVVRGYVNRHGAAGDFSLRELGRALAASQGKQVGAGTLTTALAHLNALPDPPEGVRECLARHLPGV